MLKVYVAGKLNDMATDYIKNCHKMIKCAEEVRKQGFAVYVPCIDFVMGMMFGSYDYNDYFDNSQPWLKSADAIFVCPGYETSTGTQREIATATERNIPVFFTMEDLTRWKQIHSDLDIR